MGLETATYINDLVTTNPVGTDDRSTADDHLRLIKSVLKNTVNFTGQVTATHTEINKLAGYSGAIPNFSIAGAYSAQQYFTEQALTDGAAISWDLAANQVARVTLGGNRTLLNPTNMQAGATYILRIIQDPTGSRTLSFDTAYKFPQGITPILSTGGSDVDILSAVSDGVNMYCNVLLNVS